MKDYSKTFLKLSIIYLSIIFFLLSCEEEPYLRFGEIDSIEAESNIEPYLTHYSQISTGKFNYEGDTYHLKPARWKHGGFKGTEKIDVFFHESFNNVNAKNELINFFSVLDGIIEDENIKFNVVNNIDDADITIVFGPDVYQSLLNIVPNPDRLGEATFKNEEWLSDTNSDIVNPDLCSIGEGSFWVREYNDLLIKHEFLHLLGFQHRNNINTIMNTMVDRMTNLKDIDEKAIYLKYNNDLVQVVSPNSGSVGFPDWLFTEEEYDIHLDNVKLTLENRFDL